MPRIYRAMRADGDSPMVGHTQNDTLGVREITVDANGREVGDVRPVGGLVQPCTGGMSVSPSTQALPPHLIPKRLRTHGYPDARRGSTLPDTFPWRMGDGRFSDGALCECLQLRIDAQDPEHGFVEPDREMTLTDYRAAVEVTRPSWTQERW